MKNLKYILNFIAAVVLSLSLATSCLDKYPQSAIPEGEAMQTYNDAYQHLIGVYSGLLSGNLYSGLLTLLPDIQADLVYAVEGFSNTYGNFWQWDVRSTDDEVSAVYGSLYSVIGNCNFFLDKIDDVVANETDDDRISDLEDFTGQVYAIRALCYMELAKCYCKAYMPATAEKELGLVLRTKYFEDESLARASLKDTYDLIVKDLEKAESMLNDEDDMNTANSQFFSLVAAYALHARVALYMQDWDNAIKYSSILLDDYKHLYRLASTNAPASDGASEFAYMWAYDQGPEVILKIAFTAASYGGSLGQPFLGMNTDFTYCYPDFVPASWVLNELYAVGDLRRDSYFAGSASGIIIGRPSGMEWPLLVKYFGNRGLMQTSLTTFMHKSMPMPLRLAEQYLIRAEANCRKAVPDYTAAAADINTLHSKRYQAGGAVAVTAENWLEVISDERVKELYMEGFRLHDLKRWGKGFKREYQSHALKEGASLEVTADNPLFVWPIPQHELDVPGSQILPNESNK